MADSMPESVWITEKTMAFPEYEVTEKDGTKSHYDYKTLPGYIWDCMTAGLCVVYYGPEKEVIHLEEA